MNPMPMFSVIIPTFNRAGLLREALASIFDQTYRDFDVHVVDDGSTDDTDSVVSEYEGRVNFLTQRNRGPGCARNLGAIHAAGRYLAFLDSDDVWFPWTLATYAAVVSETGKPAFVAGCPFRFEAPPALTEVLQTPLELLRFSDYFSSGDQWRWWGASSFVIRADVFHQVAGFVEDNLNGEDADLAMRLGEAPGFVQVKAPFTFGYREHSGNVTRDFRRNVQGILHKVESEKSAKYPGGATRRMERWRILTRHLRPVAVECLRGGMQREALRLYKDSFPWHCRLRNWKFLLGFPLMAMLQRVSPSSKRPNQAN